MRRMLVVAALVIALGFVCVATSDALLFTAIKERHEQLIDSVKQFSASFKSRVLVLDGLEKREPLNSFWRQLLAQLAHSEEALTIVDSDMADKGGALVKSGANTGVVAVRTLKDFDINLLDFGVRYNRGLVFRVAVLDTFASMSEVEVVQNVSSTIDSLCNGRTVKSLTITVWYLVHKNIWLRTKAYPDGQNVCSTQNVTTTFSEVDREGARAIRNFHGHALTVATVAYSPFVTFPANETLMTPAEINGADFDLLKEIGAVYNFSLDVVQPPDGKWGAQLDNGSWSGIIGMVQQKKADLACSSLSAVPTSRLAIRYLQPWEDECLRVITRSPLNLKEKELFAIFLPFPWELWVALVVLTAICATLAYLIERNRRSIFADWVLQTLFYFSAELGMGAPDRVYGPSAGSVKRAIWICWIWFTFLISTVYSTFLVSYLTIPKYETIPESIQDFIDSDVYTLRRVEWGDALDDQIKRSPDVTYVLLRKKLQFIPKSAGWEDWSSLSTLGQKVGLIEQYSDAWTAVLVQDPHQFVLSKAVWSCHPIAWAGPWNGIFNDPLNIYLKPLARFGILAKLRQLARESQFNLSSLAEYEYGRGLKYSLLNQEDDVVYLQDLISVFFVLGVGYFVSVVAFVGELFHDYCHHHARK